MKVGLPWQHELGLKTPLEEEERLHGVFNFKRLRHNRHQEKKTANSSERALLL
jgi:hypothetical protein